MSIPAVGDLLSFEGRVVVVTGSGSGLGAGLALRFGEAGAAVVVHYHTSKDGAREVVAQIKDLGAKAIPVQGDLTQRSDAGRLVAETVQAFGRLDVLVNNAGAYPTSGLVDMTDDEWDSVINANLRSAFLCTQLAARQMIAQAQGGAIVNVASIEAGNPAPRHSHYVAAKAAVVMHAKAAAFELGAHGIRVNSISPGLIWRKGIEEQWPEGVDDWKSAVPLGRLGQPEDVADACLFLASRAARWITGVNLMVDGGVMARRVF